MLVIPNITRNNVITFFTKFVISIREDPFIHFQLLNYTVRISNVAALQEKYIWLFKAAVRSYNTNTIFGQM